MKHKIAIIATLVALFMPSLAEAETLAKDIQFKFRMGYSVGATAPIGLPETIRSIDRYSLTPSVFAGIDIQKSIYGKWGILTGIHFENKAMDGDVTTKAYHMELRKGDTQMEGLFTGKVHQEVTMVMFTMPVQATYTFNDKLQIKAGPYFSLVAGKDFEGIASDGYLRQGSPTGPKIEIGNKEGEWATYDFKDDMRDFQVGMGIGLDWDFYRNLGLSVDLNWGLNGIFKKDFKTVEDTLYPIYGSVGFFYHLK